MVKGHELERALETEAHIFWSCARCGRQIGFCRDTGVEPHTDGELPAEAGDYLDPCPAG